MKTIYSLLLLLVLPLQLKADIFSRIDFDGASEIFSIVQDDDGMMWMGTNHGLHCYDGYFSYPHYAKGTQEDTRIATILYLESEQRLLLGTDVGLLIYNLNTDRYDTPPVGSPKKIRDIKIFNGQIMLGASTGLYVFDSKNNKTRLISKSPQNIYSLLSNGEKLLVGALRGLWCYENYHMKPVHYSDQPDRLVNALSWDALGTGIWVGTEGDLFHCDSELKNFNAIKELHNNSIKSFALDKNANLYIGTDNGLYKYSLSGELTKYVHDSRNIRSICNNIIWSVFSDQYNNVWLGTDLGANLLRVSSWFQYFPLFDITGMSDGNLLRVITQDSQGIYWTGGTNGLIRLATLNSENNQSTWYRPYDTKYQISHNKIRNVYEDSDGDIWVTTDHGFNLYNKTTGQFRNFILYDKTGQYSTAWSYDILLDKRGKLWISSYIGGIFVISKQKLLLSNGKVEVERHISTLNGLPGIHVGKMVQDKAGKIWALTQDQGLASINPSNYAVTKHPEMGKSGVLSLDRNGNAVLKNVIASFKVVDSEWDVFEKECKINRKNGNFDFLIPEVEAASAFYSEKDQYVYIAGNDGLLRIDPKAFSVPAKYEHLTLSKLTANSKPYEGSDSCLRKLKEMVVNYDENNIRIYLTNFPYNNHPTFVFAYMLEGNDDHWQYNRNRRNYVSYNGLAPGEYRFVVKALNDKGEPGTEVYSLKIIVKHPWFLTPWAKTFHLLLLLLIIYSLRRAYIFRKQWKNERKEKSKIQQAPVVHLMYSDDQPSNIELDRKFLEDVSAIAEANISNSDFNVTMLQNEVGMGSKQFYRRIKKLTGMTPVEYLRDIRMKRAAILLKDGNYTVSQVMYKVGYSSLGYFSKCFLKVYNTTPSEYTKQNKEQEEKPTT